MQDRDARRARQYAKIGARRRARKTAWKASGGDPVRFAEIMRGHVATGYAFYYDEPKPAHYVAPSAIWRQFAAIAVCVVAFYALGVVVIVVAGMIGYL
ncbi:hypothetical protein E1287_42810 [Actinomadura sp. KC06]|uniref:hypothetical protein n=1 Tax=Actinomadura sp. KC06 TaxID=2530369 RepID=UPI00104E7484|nr:hypothetical protein [Actinomadura sp. KC06]TDD14320.1 hypothetical protein E1287_42810 [Actinomadura sp. KC06]